MNELVSEVREKISVLLYAIFFLVFGVGLFVLLAVLDEGDGDIASIGVFILLPFVALGIYSLLAYFNHRLKVFADGSMLYSNSLGKKTEFGYTDISVIDQRMISGTLSLTLKDVNGKRFGKVEGNMKGYEELCQWLTAQRTKNNGVGAAVSPVNGNTLGMGSRIFLGFMGAMMLVPAIGCLVAFSDMEPETEEVEEVVWFDPFSEVEGKQMVEFGMISYPFASFELSDTQEFYFVLDSDMVVYIVCMDREQFENDYAAIYDYTFSDDAEFPGLASIEGYAMEIDEELREYAIEEFNYFWGSEVFTDVNLDEYVGYYYLDATYQPVSDEESPFVVLAGGLLCLFAGVYFLYLAIRPKKKETAEKEEKSQEIVTPKDTSAEALGLTHEPEEVGELPIPGNIFVAILASIVCAMGGGLVWILVYKLGRITYLAGLLAVMGAIYGYSKIGKRELTTGAAIWCILVGLASIFFANYISYAWEIMDAVNASNPGRTDFIKVFTNMPWLMEEMELWGSFFADLGIGIFFALIGGVSSLFGNKKKK